MLKENFEEAFINFDKAIEKNPENSEYYFRKAHILVTMNNLKEALFYYDTAIEKNSKNSACYYGKGNN